MLSFKISQKLTTALRRLSQKIARLHEVASKLDTSVLEYIERSARISNIGASTRIENAVLTDAEIDWIDTTLIEDGKTTAFYDQRQFIEDKLSKDKERSISEVVGCRDMLKIMYEQASDLFPLTEVNLRGLHKELLRYYAPAEYHSGGYKQVPNSVIRRVGNRQYPVLTTADPGLETEQAMQELVDWYNETLPNDTWSIAVAIEFVFRFLAIHPFQDGNGRIGRGLFNLALLQSPDESLSFITPYIAIDRHIEKRREEYYLVLRQCSDGKFLSDPTKYQYEYFLSFAIKVIDESLQDFDVYREKYNALQRLSETALKVLACFKEQPETRLQTKNIAEQVDFSRTTIVESLNTLVEKGFIQKWGQKSGVRYQLVF